MRLTKGHKTSLWLKTNLNTFDPVSFLPLFALPGLSVMAVAMHKIKIDFVPKDRPWPLKATRRAEVDINSRTFCETLNCYYFLLLHLIMTAVKQGSFTSSHRPGKSCGKPLCSFQGNRPFLYLLLPCKNQGNIGHEEGKVQMPKSSPGKAQLWSWFNLKVDVHPIISQNAYWRCFWWKYIRNSLESMTFTFIHIV